MPAALGADWEGFSQRVWTTEAGEAEGPREAGQGKRRGVSWSLPSRGYSGTTAVGGGSDGKKLRDTPLLILDEPISAIDAETQALLMAGLERLIVGRTTFSIAQARACCGAGSDREPPIRGRHHRWIAGPGQSLSPLCKGGSPVVVGPWVGMDASCQQKLCGAL